MLMGVFGNLGSGKTMLLTVFALRLVERGDYEVYANYTIRHPKIRKITPLELININPLEKRALLILDEVYAWLDSRVSTSTLNRYLSWIILQSRKRNMDIIYSAQLLRLPDIRLKELSDIIVLAENRQSGFFYKFIWQKGLSIFSKKIVLPYQQAKNYFNLYDTREIVEPIFFEKMRSQIMGEIDIKSLNTEIDKIVDMVMPKIKNRKITKSLIEAVLLEIGKPRSLTDIIYGKLKLRGI
jgi:hypothetical protein